jgi:membrane-associated protease RseP (regulator of RpoE activity)
MDFTRGNGTMTTGWGWVRGLAISASVLALTMGAPTTGTAAQQIREECRCVDADGNAIADCTCFRAPRLEALERLERMGPFMAGMNRPRLGINVSTEQTSELDARGAEVTNVLEDGPAWDAGIREGDVITAIDGQSLFEPLSGDREDDFDLDQSIPVQRLLALARELEPGEDVEVTYVRGGEERRTTVTAEDLAGRTFEFVPGFDAERLRDQLRDLNEDLPRFQWRGPGPGDPDVSILRGSPGTALFFDGSRFGRFGLELVELNAGLGQYFGTEQGTLVVNVSEDSTLGLQPGDVILRIGDRPADTPDRVLRILGSYGADEDITIHVRRNGREMSVMGRLEG